AALQALRSGFQAASMAFGPAAIGIWPASVLIISLIALESAIQLIRIGLSQPEERFRATGLLLFLAAVAFMSYGIGWGRCTFLADDGGPGGMGLSSRYGWIVWPGLGTLYFQWLIYGGNRVSHCAPIALLVITVIMLPFNVVTGF